MTISSITYDSIIIHNTSLGFWLDPSTEKTGGGGEKWKKENNVGKWLSRWTQGFWDKIWKGSFFHPLFLDVWVNNNIKALAANLKKDKIKVGIIDRISKSIILRSVIKNKHNYSFPGMIMLVVYKLVSSCLLTLGIFHWWITDLNIGWENIVWRKW